MALIPDHFRTGTNGKTVTNVKDEWSPGLLASAFGRISSQRPRNCIDSENTPGIVPGFVGVFVPWWFDFSSDDDSGLPKRSAPWIIKLKPLTNMDRGP